MEIVVKEDVSAFCRAVAMEVSRQILVRPNSVIGLATGKTTLGIHAELVKVHEQWEIDYSRVSTFNLDEYVGLDPRDPRSCRARTLAQFLDHVNIRRENIHVPDGTATSLEQECRDYEEQIARCAGVDVQILSLGTNGHIAFNEPGTSFDTVTRIAPIAEATIVAKAEQFGSREAVPKEGFTMGIKSIMRSKRIFLVASGEHKAEAITKALYGPVTTDVPASVVQLHPCVAVIVDRAASSGIFQAEKQGHSAGSTSEPRRPE